MFKTSIYVVEPEAYSIFCSTYLSENLRKLGICKLSKVFWIKITYYLCIYTTVNRI